LQACRSDLAEPSESGFCLVDERPDPGEEVDSPALEARRKLVAECPAEARRILRFGPDIARENASLYVTCDDQ
jgi:hypothetical protein